MTTAESRALKSVAALGDISAETAAAYALGFMAGNAASVSACNIVNALHHAHHTATNSSFHIDLATCHN